MLNTSRRQWSKSRLITALRSKTAWVLIVLSSITVAFFSTSCFFLLVMLTEVETSIWMKSAGGAINIVILFSAFFVPYIGVPILFSKTWRVDHSNKDEGIRISLIRRAVAAWVFIEAVSTKLFIDTISNIFNFGEIDHIFYIIVFCFGVIIAFLMLMVIRLQIELREDENK